MMVADTSALMAVLMDEFHPLICDFSEFPIDGSSSVLERDQDRLARPQRPPQAAEQGLAAVA